MTNLEAFKFKAGNGVSDEDATAALNFAEVDSAGTWNPNDGAAKCAFYGALLAYLDKDNVGIRQETEGGYSKSYDTVAKGAYMSKLADESGCANLIDKYGTQPKVRNKSYVW